MQMTDKIYGIIYKISFPNGKKYIGQTRNSIKQRKGEHISCSRSNKPKYILHKAIKLYGEESFEMIEIANAINKEELNSLEIYYIKENNTYFKNGSGYNMTFGGEGNSGYVFTDEIKKKMSINKKIYLHLFSFKTPIKYNCPIRQCLFPYLIIFEFLKDALPFASILLCIQDILF